MTAPIQLVVGLGNPGTKYERTRHNAGFWFVEALARAAGTQLRAENKFHGEACKVRLHGRELWLLKPQTYMNRSGMAVAALANFYKIEPQAVLVAHDELDLPPGAAKLKQGGGHAGHNGLRDIIAQLGSKEFVRLRLGIGHPGHPNEVTGHVLGKTPEAERSAIDAVIDQCVELMPLLLEGDLQAAMNRLHGKK